MTQTSDAAPDPTVADADRVEPGDIDRKRDRLAELLEAELARQAAEPQLTLDQRRLWFLRQLSPSRSMR